MTHEGLHKNRLGREPRERAYADLWESWNSETELGATYNILSHILSSDTREPAELSGRDRLVAATVIQWLGSEIGQFFLLQARVLSTVYTEGSIEVDGRVWVAAREPE